MNDFKDNFLNCDCTVNSTLAMRWNKLSQSSLKLVSEKNIICNKHIPNNTIEYIINMLFIYNTFYINI